MASEILRVAGEIKASGVEEVIILAPAPRADVSEVERKVTEVDLFSVGWRQGFIIRKLNMGYELDRASFIGGSSRKMRSIFVQVFSASGWKRKWLTSEEHQNGAGGNSPYTG